jgi:hypothetical protein
LRGTLFKRWIKAALGRLRKAITAADGDAKDQLDGVLRMLGAQIPDKTQLPLFGKAPAGQEPSFEARLVRRPKGA